MLVLKPERCTYTDVMGIERLRVALDYKAGDLKGTDLPEKLVARYSKGEVELSEANGEYFRVLKMGRGGYGFGRPLMESIFEGLTTEESFVFVDRDNIKKFEGVWGGGEIRSSQNISNTCLVKGYTFEVRVLELCGCPHGEPQSSRSTGRDAPATVC